MQELTEQECLLGSALRCHEQSETQAFSRDLLGAQRSSIVSNYKAGRQIAGNSACPIRRAFAMAASERTNALRAIGTEGTNDFAKVPSVRSVLL
jgi:hypothetical protein